MIWSYIVHVVCRITSYYVRCLFNYICFALINLVGHAPAIIDTERLNKLAAFQKKALAHALSCKFVCFYMIHQGLSLPCLFSGLEIYIYWVEVVFQSKLSLIFCTSSLKTLAPFKLGVLVCLLFDPIIVRSMYHLHKIRFLDWLNILFNPTSKH